MTEETLEYDPALRPVLLDLFTEVAILEHLTRKRVEPLHLGDVTAAEFGLINFFCRLGKTEEKLSGLAWCFQVEVEDMRTVVDAMAARGFVSLDMANDPCVRMTEAGTAFHEHMVEDMAPVIAPVVAELSAEDLRITARTLTEIRRTMDNLPDR